MTRLTIGEAVQAGWGSRASLYRLVKAGKLSTQADGDRQVIDVAELVRVLGEPRSRRRIAAGELLSAPDVSARVMAERDVADLREQVIRLSAELSAERAAARDASAAAAEERRRLLDMVERSQKLLVDMREEDRGKRRWQFWK
jgi:predicted site-specific integrase-resolvase